MPEAANIAQQARNSYEHKDPTRHFLVRGGRSDVKLASDIKSY